MIPAMQDPFLPIYDFDDLAPAEDCVADAPPAPDDSPFPTKAKIDELMRQLAERDAEILKLQVELKNCYADLSLKKTPEAPAKPRDLKEIEDADRQRSMERRLRNRFPEIIHLEVEKDLRSQITLLHVMTSDGQKHHTVVNSMTAWQARLGPVEDILERQMLNFLLGQGYGERAAEFALNKRYHEAALLNGELGSFNGMQFHLDPIVTMVPPSVYDDFSEPPVMTTSVNRQFPKRNGLPTSAAAAPAAPHTTTKPVDWEGIMKKQEDVLMSKAKVNQMWLDEWCVTPAQQVGKLAVQKALEDAFKFGTGIVKPADPSV